MELSNTIKKVRKEIGELEIIKKAYRVIDPNILECGMYYSEDDWEIVYAKSPGDAKSKCSEYENYLNIKCKRAAPDDYVRYNGEEIKRRILFSRMESEIKRDFRKQKVLQYPETEMFYIQNGYVGNCVLWWGLNNHSYTYDISHAQKYSREQVLNQFVNGRDEDIIWAASHVEQHISQHVDSQYLDCKFKC